MNQLERIRKMHVRIMSHKTWCAFGPLVAAGTTTCTTDIPTAATNGIDKRYNPNFVKSLSDEELRFVILHEATHVAYMHLDVWKHLWDEDQRLTNLAADYFVNLSLQDSDKGEGFIKMPSVGVPPDPQYRGMSVQQIYNRLKDEQKQKGQQGQGGCQPGEGFDQHQWEEAQARGDSQKLADEVGRLLRQGEIVRRQRSKDGAGGADGVIGDLLTPKVDWRRVLREFVQELCSGRDESSWRKPNRRYLAQDVYLPSMQGVKMGALVVGFDTSGSCFGTDVMTAFAAEVAGIVEQVRPEKVIVVYWDTRVAGHQVFEDGQFAVLSMKPQGGGGTRGEVLFDWLREQKIQAQAVVQLTDGEVGSFGKSDWPTLWCITNKRIKAPYGTTVHLEV
jgi:predicted metal-dependent peptidase